MSRPSKRMLPEGWLAAGYGRSFITDSAVTDLPEPDSPTSATVSPLLHAERDAIDRDRHAAGLVKRNREIADVEQFFGRVHRLPERLARIEGVADRLADEDQKRQHDRHRHKRGNAEPRRLDVGLALLEHLAE